MRLLADENFPKPIIEMLRTEGHDVLWVRTDLSGAKDVALLDLAESEARTVVTLDRDFWQIAIQRRSPLEKSGVVRSSSPPSREDILDGAMKSCWIYFCAAVALSGAIPEPVKTDAGLVSGTSGASAEIRVFRGIPYAAPPVGALRWKAPQPVAKWDGVKKAEQFSPRCVQGGGPNAGAVSEDCLYVNVWTPAKSASEKLPVMVWTYGGGFTGGAGSLPMYESEELAKKGVVVVTYNYRLGMFGFFAHPELTKESAHKASGNYGMMDMKAALGWVQKNIAAFGGDPKKVTIFGESAGAIMVGAMVASPEGKGLFIRAMAESGAFMGLRMGSMTTLQMAEENGVKLAGGASIADLRAKPAEEIQKMSRQAGLIVDGYMIPEDPGAVFAKGKQNAVDVLIGSNRDEGTFFTRGTTVDAFTKQARERYGAHAEEFLKLYPAGSDAEAVASELRDIRDEVVWHDQLWARDMTKKGKKAFVYYFTEAPPGDRRGATHVAEIAYVFHHPGQAWKPEDQKLSDEMTTYWTNFAKTGNPGADWPAWDGKTHLYKVLGPEPSADQAPSAAQLMFFDEAYQRSLMP